MQKIAQFIASCDDMINGKFILADVKITKVLNMIAGSEELYRYISECMVGFDFNKEYHRAEVKNGLNGGVFSVPTDPQKLVAFVFCVLVECDAKRLDFYNFINENFGWESKSNAYKNFAEKLLTPFKEIISSHFGLLTENNQSVSAMTDSYRQELKENPIFEEEKNVTYSDMYAFKGSSQEVNSQEQAQYLSEEPSGYDYAMQSANQQGAYANSQTSQGSMQNRSMMQNQYVEEKQEPDVWKEICDICENIESAVYAERHLKEYLKEELLYITKTIKYSTKYKDVKIISALVTAFDELTKKFRSIQFVFGELKNKI